MSKRGRMAMELREALLIGDMERRVVLPVSLSVWSDEFRKRAEEAKARLRVDVASAWSRSSRLDLFLGCDLELKAGRRGKGTPAGGRWSLRVWLLQRLQAGPMAGR
jgi:hypothetical protein